MTSTRILVLAGGRSGEHEVSITSARSVLGAMQQTSLTATAVVVTRQGRWLSSTASETALRVGHAASGGDSPLQGACLAEQFDVIFPLIHGPFGEDGTVQGMLELAGLPYVGSGVLGSALCMDKAMTKDVLRSHQVPQVRHVLVTRQGYQKNATQLLASLRDLPGPWFVKPANLGSSVGISKVREAAALPQAIEQALQYDRRVIVEEGLDRPRELEVAVLGNDDAQASPVGEITFDADFYDYATKYTVGRSRMHIPADVPENIAARAREMSLQAFHALDCAGFARVDFFYQEKTGQLLLNEVNTIPGFTPFSMFPKLWEATGMSYGKLIETLVSLARERHRPRTSAL